MRIPARLQVNDKSAFIKIGANKHRMRHKPAPECPAVNASACCGNLDNLKEFPAIGGERCLAIAVWRIRLRYSETGLFSLRHFFAPIFLLLCKTAIVDFLWERGKINCDLSKTFGSLSEGAGSAVFFRRDWRSLDLGFCFALDPITFHLFRGCRLGEGGFKI